MSVREAHALNVEAYGGDVALVTIAAPSGSGEAWATLWTESVGLRWRLLRRACVRRLDAAPTFVARVWEQQSRNVPHLHLVLGCRTSADLGTASAFVDVLRELAQDFDFGYVDGGPDRGVVAASELAERLRAVSGGEA